VAIVLSVICVSFCGSIVLSVIFFSFCGYYFVSHLFLKQMTDKIIATKRKTNDRQYNSHRKKNK
jgi:uncharacterized protein YneF (UPF0154 family)